MLGHAMVLLVTPVGCVVLAHHRIEALVLEGLSGTPLEKIILLSILGGGGGVGMGIGVPHVSPKRNNEYETSYNTFHMKFSCSSHSHMVTNSSRSPKGRRAFTRLVLFC